MEATPNSASVSRGQSATYAINVASQNGFADSVTFICASAPPQAATARLILRLSARRRACEQHSVDHHDCEPIRRGSRQNGGIRKRILLWSHRPLRCSDFAPPQQKKVWLALMSGLALIALLSMAGCGGGVNNGSRNQTIDSGRALGTYAVTITGASGATQPERFRYAYGSLSRPAVDRNLRREPDIQRVPPICQTPIPSGY